MNLGKRAKPPKAAHPKPTGRPYGCLSGPALADEMANLEAKTKEEREELLLEVYNRYVGLAEKSARKIKMKGPALSPEDAINSLFAEKLFCPDVWRKFLSSGNPNLNAYLNETARNYLLDLAGRQQKGNKIVPWRLEDEISAGGSEGEATLTFGNTLEDPGIGIEEAVMAKEVVRKALLRSENPYRDLEVVKLRLKGCKAKDIAEQLGLSSDNVNKIYSRFHERAEEILAEGPEEVE